MGAHGDSQKDPTIEKLPWFFRWYTKIICYRYEEDLYNDEINNQENKPLKLQLPYYWRKDFLGATCGQPLTTDKIREKATSSLTTCGIFFAFSIAIVAAMMTGDKAIERLSNAINELFTWKTILGLIIGFMPCLVIWLERLISKLEKEKIVIQEKIKIKEKRKEPIDNLEAKKNKKLSEQCNKKKLFKYLFAINIFLLLFVSSFVLMVVKFVLSWVAPAVVPGFDSWLMSSYTGRVSIGLGLMGLFLVIFSIFFLFFAIEFYDSAAGWRRSVEYNFHLASIGSHSYMIGVSLILMGTSLTLCLFHPWWGRIISCLSLVVLVWITENERFLSRMPEK